MARSLRSGAAIAPLGAVMVALLPAAALGAGPAAPPTPPSATARPAATRPAALRAYAQGQYQEALAMFLDLYVQDGRPEYLLDIARCHQNLAQHDKAVESVRAYLRRAKRVTPDEKRQLDEMIADIEKARAAGSGTTRPAAPASAAAPAAASPPSPSPSPSPSLPAPGAWSPPPASPPAPASAWPQQSSSPSPSPQPVWSPPPAPPPVAAPSPAVQLGPPAVAATAAPPSPAATATAAEAERASFSGGRYVVELLVSALGASLAGYGVYSATCGDEACFGGAMAALGTNILAVPVITYGVGRMMGGKGAFSTTFYGAALGLGVGSPISGQNPSLGLAIGLAMMPVMAPLGFELSSNNRSKEMKAGIITARMAPALWPVASAKGIVSGGLVGFAGTL